CRHRSTRPLPRPPRSTLFPYTTLFRSLQRMQLVAPCDAFDGGDVGTIVARRQCQARINATAVDQNRAGAALTAVAALLDSGQIQDRKSTRLNSSHQIISYAVFCLKKNR